MPGRAGEGWRRRSNAFTLIEMLVVLAIVMVITASVLVSSNQFNGSILLRSLASQIGLSMREAQLYGVSVKQVTVAGASGEQQFNSTYGVYVNAATVYQPKGTYYLFADVNQNGVYDPGEEVETFHLQNGFTISNICAESGTTYSCSHDCSFTPPAGTSCTASPFNWLTVSFTRPDPNANFATDAGAGNYTGALLVVKAPSGGTRMVSVSKTGLISIL